MSVACCCRYPRRTTVVFLAGYYHFSAMEDEPEKSTPRKRTGKPVTLRCFLTTVACFVAALIILGLGLAVGLTRSHSPLLASVASYGIPDGLSTIPTDDLVNAKQLNLETDFVVSSDATVRTYEFNITQAYAAPDGVYKPMILVNKQSPGPLIEVNNGDTLRVRRAIRPSLVA